MTDVNKVEHIYEDETEIDRLSSRLHNKYIGVEPMLLIAAIALLIIYYYIFSSLGNNEDGQASTIKVFFETLLWFLFVVLLLLNGISYIFGIDLIKTLKKLLGYKTVSLKTIESRDKYEIDLMVNSPDQVFHLPNQNYSYDDAGAVCKAYNSRLAKYDEVNDAYTKGADWCSYGWTEGQMAIFPTQEEKWNKLQTLPGHEKECGHPGLNGGYIDKPDLTFGVNCFGTKPAITPDEANCMKDTPLYKKNKKELQFDQKVEYWRNNLSQVAVAPFNHNNWSMI